MTAHAKLKTQDTSTFGLLYGSFYIYDGNKGKYNLTPKFEKIQ